MATTLYREFIHSGLDTLSSVSRRRPGFFTNVINVCPTLSDSIIKRPGRKAVAPSIGGEGLFNYARQDNDVVEALTLHQGALYRHTPTSVAINYTGTGVASITFGYDDDQAEFALFLYVDGVEVLNFDCSLGVDGDTTSPTLADLKLDVDALADFDATVTGTDTLQAAFLFPLKADEVIEDSVTLETFDWEAVNSPLLTPLSTHWATRNASDYQRATHVDVLGNKYIATKQVELMKYDGQTFYRAGMPQPTPPLLDNISASGQAEVTVITCVADSTAAEVSQVIISNPVSWDHDQSATGFIIYDNSGDSVGVEFRNGGGGHHNFVASRYIPVNYALGATNAAIATATKVAVDADADFVATVVGTTVAITNSVVGAHTSIAVGDDTDVAGRVIFTVSTLTEGTSGLDGKYFILGGPNETIAFWYDIDGGGTPEPAHGATRGVKIATVSAGDSAATVATATEVVIEADLFNSTVSSNVITATSSTGGVRADATPGTSGFGISITTQGVNDGLGAGAYAYHLTYEQIDNNGIITEGLFSDDAAITLSSGEDTSLTLPQIQADSGFNTNCAIVNGDQVNKNTITVDSGHTMKVGDSAFFKGQSQGGIQEISTITTVADVSGSLDGTWFYLFTQVGTSVQSWAFWFDVDNNGTAEPAHGATNAVKITAVSTGNTANQVATAVGNAINGTGKWTRSTTNNVVTVTDVLTGPRTDIYNGAVSTGFTMAVTRQGSDPRVGDNELRLVTAITSTTITIDGDPATVSDNSVISNGLKVKIWRTETAGFAINKFLVDTLPNNSFVPTVVYEDGVSNSTLEENEVWNEPALDHGLPPKGAYVSAWNTTLVMGGIPSAPSTLYYAIAGQTSPEYFPPESNQILLNSIYGDKIRGLYPLGEGFLGFKDTSYFTLSGDIYADNIRVDQSVKQDIHFFSQHSFLDRVDKVLYLDEFGVYSLSPGTPPVEISPLIRPSFNIDDSAPIRANSFNHRHHKRSYFFLPVEATTGPARYATTDSQVYVLYDPNAFSTGGRRSTDQLQWYVWDNFNMAGGMVLLDNQVFFQEERFDTDTNETKYYLYLLSESGTKYDYVDHNEPIAASYTTARYGAESPEVYKKMTKVRTQHDPVHIGVNEEIHVQTQLGLTGTTIHSDFTLLPDTVGRAKQRLLPTKSTAIAFTFSNNRIYENMALIGWTLEGGSLSAEHMKE